MRYHPSHQNKSVFAFFVSHLVSWCNVSHVACQFRHKQFRTQIPCQLMRTFNFQGGISISRTLVLMKCLNSNVFRKIECFCVHLVLFRSKAVTWDPFQALAKTKDFLKYLFFIVFILFIVLHNKESF